MIASRDTQKGFTEHPCSMKPCFLHCHKKKKCGRRDLNPHGIATTGTWSLRVCQFRHFRITAIFIPQVSVVVNSIFWFFYIFCIFPTIQTTYCVWSYVHSGIWYKRPFSFFWYLPDRITNALSLYIISLVKKKREFDFYRTLLCSWRDLNPYPVIPD